MSICQTAMIIFQTQNEDFIIKYNLDSILKINYTLTSKINKNSQPNNSKSQASIWIQFQET